MSAIGNSQNCLVYVKNNSGKFLSSLKVDIHFIKNDVRIGSNLAIFNRISDGEVLKGDAFVPGRAKHFNKYKWFSSYRE